MDEITIKCKDCEHWKPTENKIYVGPKYDLEKTIGICSELNYSECVDINISAGWDGGYVEKITTTENFFCAAFKKQKCKLCGKISGECTCAY